MVVKNLTELNALAIKLLANWQRPKDRALVIGLIGDLGAGKTTFTQMIARALGMAEPVTSPTFVIEKMYALPANASTEYGFTRFVHLDCYRLKGPEELLVLGWQELISHPQTLVLVEWADRVEAVLPEGAKKIFFTPAGESSTEREIIYS